MQGRFRDVLDLRRVWPVSVPPQRRATMAARNLKQARSHLEPVARDEMTNIVSRVVANNQLEVLLAEIETQRPDKVYRRSNPPSESGLSEYSLLNSPPSPESGYKTDFQRGPPPSSGAHASPTPGTSAMSSSTPGTAELFTDTESIPTSKKAACDRDDHGHYAGTAVGNQEPYGMGSNPSGVAQVCGEEMVIPEASGECLVQQRCSDLLEVDQEHLLPGRIEPSARQSLRPRSLPDRHGVPDR